MTAEERDFLKERVAIAVEHLPEAEAQAVFDAIVGAMTGEEDPATRGRGDAERRDIWPNDRNLR